MYGIKTDGKVDHYMQSPHKRYVEARQVQEIVGAYKGFSLKYFHTHQLVPVDLHEVWNRTNR